MTIEERVQQIIGSQVITICNLQAQLEQVQAELEKIKSEQSGDKTNVATFFGAREEKVG